MNKIKIKSALVLNQIDYKVISSFPEISADQLLSIYNKIFSDSVFPNRINILWYLYLKLAILISALSH